MNESLPIWCAGSASCSCGHVWAAVWPAGAEDLECPACGDTDTEREAA